MLRMAICCLNHLHWVVGSIRRHERCWTRYVRILLLAPRCQHECVKHEKNYEATHI